MRKIRTKIGKRSRKVSKVGMVAIAILIASSLIITAALMGLIGGFQETDVTVTGKTPDILFDGQALYGDLSITEDLSNMAAGQYQEFSHTLQNQNADDTFIVSFAIDDTWFAAPTDPSYGYTYLVKDENSGVGGVEITDVIIPPCTSVDVFFCHDLHTDFMTPTIPTVTTKIDLTGEIAPLVGRAGMYAEGRGIWTSFNVDTYDMVMTAPLTLVDVILGGNGVPGWENWGSGDGIGFEFDTNDALCVTPGFVLVKETELGDVNNCIISTNINRFDPINCDYASGVILAYEDIDNHWYAKLDNGEATNGFSNVFLHQIDDGIDTMMATGVTSFAPTTNMQMIVTIDNFTPSIIVDIIIDGNPSEEIINYTLP